MPRVKRPEYARINWRRLTAERNRKWEQMKQAFASEGIIGRPLWDSAPGFDPSFGQNAPRLFVLPLRPERGMVIVCAGGAFLFQSSNEAKPVAEFFHNAGLNAAVLEYRVKPYEVPAIPIQDGLRAVRFVRTYAAQWGIPQDKIAIGGFSRRGHAFRRSRHPLRQRRPEGAGPRRSGLLPSGRSAAPLWGRIAPSA